MSDSIRIFGTMINAALNTALYLQQSLDKQPFPLVLGMAPYSCHCALAFRLSEKLLSLIELNALHKESG